MKTIKQIADEMGVSKQAVQKRIAREPLCTSIQPYISTNAGTKYIEDTGITLIKAAFSAAGPTTQSIPVHTDKKETMDILVSMLQKELDRKDSQLAAKDRQITDLSAQLAATTDALLAAQKTIDNEQLLHARTMKQLPAPSLWSRIFSRKEIQE